MFLQAFDRAEVEKDLESWKKFMQRNDMADPNKVCARYKSLLLFSSVMSLPRHAQIEPDRLPRQARDKRKENSPKTSIQQCARLLCVLRVACVLFCQSWRAHWEDNNSIYNNLGTAQRFNLIGRNLFWLILALSILVENLGSSVEHLWCDRQNQTKPKQNKSKPKPKPKPNKDRIFPIRNLTQIDFRFCDLETRNCPAQEKGKRKWLLSRQAETGQINFADGSQFR